MTPTSAMPQEYRDPAVVRLAELPLR